MMNIESTFLNRKVFLRRFLVASFILSLLFASLITHLFVLQVREGEHYATMADDNRIRLSAVPPARGIIYARDDSLLAYNRFRYVLRLHPSKIKNKDQLFEQISSMVELDSHQQKMLQQVSSESSHNHRPVSLKNNLNSSEIAKLTVNNHRMAGVEIVGEPVRYYPEEDIFAHVIGYLGRFANADYRRVDHVQKYRRNGYIGRSGIEYKYEKLLHGKPGWVKTEVNAEGKELRLLSGKKAVSGQDLMLSIDPDLQSLIHNALGEHKGSVVALDPRTGEVLALVSKPSFDPNQMMHGLSHEQYQSIINRKDRPLFHRAVSGRYPPGSTVKPIVALAGLHHQFATAQHELYAGPSFTVNGSTRKFRDWKKTGHGLVDLRKSIAQSCDVFFYDLAYRMGLDRLAESFTQFGLGTKTGIDTLYEQPGLVPTRQWKMQTHQLPWYPEETIITGIGQGFLLATPLQLAQIAAMIGMRGTQFKPYIVRAIRPSGASTWSARKPIVQAQASFDKDDWDLVINGMVDAVHRPNGTAYGIGRDAPYIFAGKTGTVQLYGLDEDEEYDPSQLDKALHDHAMFIAFAPAHKPEIAIAVVVENGGSGAKVAAPIARQVLDAYFGVIKTAHISHSAPSG